MERRTNEPANQVKTTNTRPRRGVHRRTGSDGDVRPCERRVRPHRQPLFGVRCGSGNFIAEIFTRKIATAKKLYKSNPYDYERYAVLVVTSIYGVEILAANVEECRKRLFALWDKEYSIVYKKLANDKTREAVQYILLKANDKPKNGQASIFDVPEEIRKYLSVNPASKRIYSGADM